MARAPVRPVSFMGRTITRAVGQGEARATACAVCTVYYILHTMAGFGSYVRARREAKRRTDERFSVRQVAERIGVEPSFLSKVASDLQRAIRKRPELFAALIRELKDMPDHTVLRLVREVRDGNW